MRKIPYVLLAVSLLAVGVLGFRSQQERAARSALEQQVQELQSQILALPSAAQPQSKPGTDPIPDPATRRPADSGQQVPNITEYIRALEEARATTESTRQELSSVRNDLAEAELQRTKEREQREQLVAELQEAEEQIASGKRAITVLEAELRSRNERLAKLETNEKLLREAIQKAEQVSARITRSVGELEDINRRREALIANIVRRYRDVTDLYRTLSLRLQDRAGQQGFEQGAGELSRIQNSVQQAEEEFRQVSALNAQVARMIQGVR